MRGHQRLLLLILVLLPAVLISFSAHAGMTWAQEDEDALEDEEAVVEGDEDIGADSGHLTEQEGGDDEEEEEEFMPLQPSPDAETTILFIKPTSADELPAGELVKVLVGFANHGDKEFSINYLEASFRYPQDYSFHIQNFSLIEYQRTVEPGRQASFSYNFIPSETFSARPFGLVLNLNYKDMDGTYYQDAVFNQTIQVVEVDDGLDGETFFLYVFLAAVAVLLLVAGQQFLSSVGGKNWLKSSQQTVEVGTNKNTSNVDFDWIPKQTLNDINKTPKGTKTSPRNRRVKRAQGAESD